MIEQRKAFYQYLDALLTARGVTAFYDSDKEVEETKQFVKVFFRSTGGDKIAIGENTTRMEGVVTAQVFTPVGFYGDHLELVIAIYDAFKTYSARGILRMQQVRIVDLGTDPVLPHTYSNVIGDWIIDN